MGSRNIQLVLNIVTNTLSNRSEVLPLSLEGCGWNRFFPAEITYGEDFMVSTAEPGTNDIPIIVPVSSGPHSNVHFTRQPACSVSFAVSPRMATTSGFYFVITLWSTVLRRPRTKATYMRMRQLPMANIR